MTHGITKNDYEQIQNDYLDCVAGWLYGVCWLEVAPVLGVYAPGLEYDQLTTTVLFIL